MVTKGQVPQVSGVQEEVGTDTAGITTLGGTMLTMLGMLISSEVLISAAGGEHGYSKLKKENGINLGVYWGY